MKPLARLDPGWVSGGSLLSPTYDQIRARVFEAWYYPYLADLPDLKDIQASGTVNVKGALINIG